jgi:hypothetical protein
MCIRHEWNFPVLVWNLWRTLWWWIRLGEFDLRIESSWHESMWPEPINVYFSSQWYTVMSRWIVYIWMHVGLHVRKQRMFRHYIWREQLWNQWNAMQCSRQRNRCMCRFSMFIHLRTRLYQRQEHMHLVERTVYIRNHHHLRSNDERDHNDTHTNHDIPSVFEYIANRSHLLFSAECDRYFGKYGTLYEYNCKSIIWTMTENKRIEVKIKKWDHDSAHHVIDSNRTM